MKKLDFKKKTQNLTLRDDIRKIAADEQVQTARGCAN